MQETSIAVSKIIFKDRHVYIITQKVLAERELVPKYWAYQKTLLSLMYSFYGSLFNKR